MSPPVQRPYGTPLPLEDDEFILRDLVRMVRQQPGWAIGITAVVAAAATLYAYSMPAIYSADALLQVQASNPDSAPLARASQMMGGDKPLPTETEIEIIRSRSVLEPVVNAFRLNVSVAPVTIPFIGNVVRRFATTGEPAPAWFGLKSYAWGGEQIDVELLGVPPALEDVPLTLRLLEDGAFALFDPNGVQLLTGRAGAIVDDGPLQIRVGKLVARPGTEFTVTRANQLAAIEELGKSLLVVEQGKQTGIVQISMESSDRVAAMQIANAVAQSYVRQNLERHQEETARTLEFVNAEVPRVRADLEKAEDALAALQQRQGAVRPTSEAQSYLQGGLEIDRQIAMLTLQRTQLLQRFMPAHPDVQTIDAQLSQLRAMQQKLEARFRDMPASEKSGVRMERDVKIAQEIYISLQNKAQELMINRAGMVGNVHILDEALIPSLPVKPKRALIIAAGLILGFVLAVLTVFMRRAVFGRMREIEEIERRLALPMFGEIPFSPAQSWLKASEPPELPMPVELAGAEHAPVAPERAEEWLPAATRPVLAESRPHDEAIEALCGICTQFQFTLKQMGHRVVAIVGATSGVGKSFVAVNLATLLARSNRRVLLIDADLRRHRLPGYFNRAAGMGLSELLGGRLDADQAAVPTGVPNLWLVPAGNFGATPAELLMNTRLRQALESYARTYDLVIIDTPPVLDHNDAMLVAALAGATVLVLRAGVHTEQQIVEAVKRLKRAGGNVVGGILNTVSRNGGHRPADSMDDVVARATGQAA
ncbi:polysaccharide biosynthesis tyrosine autokinase [Sorangium sp. So ce726]|uniref:polysaccharide biosynthesis tyrosine autokinase n=1 Tax=Sorangium sp. So ce726 TaxID=3133319 RepID=UPI003F61B424